MISFNSSTLRLCKSTTFLLCDAKLPFTSRPSNSGFDLDTAEGREFALADNQTAKSNIDFDFDYLESELGEDTLEEWGIEIPEEEILEASIETFEPVEILEQSPIQSSMIEPEIIEEQSIVEEVFEEIVEAPVEETPTEEITEETVMAEEPIEETIEVAEAPTEEIVTEQSVEEPMEEVNETEVVEETERDTDTNESNGDVVAEEREVDNESRSLETELTVEEISIKVADKIKTIDGQLKATQMIVAKVMARDNKIASYSQVNTDIFIQPELQSIDIGTYTNSTYVDIRNIYPNQTYEDKLWTSRQ